MPRLRQRDQFSAAVDAAMGFGSTEQKAHRGLGPKGTDCAIVHIRVLFGEQNSNSRPLRF